MQDGNLYTDDGKPKTTKEKNYDKSQKSNKSYNSGKTS